MQQSGSVQSWHCCHTASLIVAVQLACICGATLLLLMVLKHSSSSSAHLCLYTLACVHHQHRSLAGRKAARHLQQQRHL
jgi:hypothetical protein